MKHLKPNITNATQELSKVMDGANQAVFFKMHQIIRYVLDTRSLGLKLEPKEKKEPLVLYVSPTVTMLEIQ